MLTTREFLRDFKHWKTKLNKGNLETIEIPISEQNIMKITVVRKMTPFERSMEQVLKAPLRGLKRPTEDIF